MRKFFLTAFAGAASATLLLAACKATDMAGNVKEWCWNQGGGDKRYILGGAWNEPSYLLYHGDVQAAFSRAPTHGFRCASYLSDKIPEAALAELDRAKIQYEILVTKPSAEAVRHSVEMARSTEGLNATGAIQGGLVALAAEEAASSLSDEPRGSNANLASKMCRSIQLWSHAIRRMRSN